MERQISFTLIVSRGQYSDDIPPNFKPKIESARWFSGYSPVSYGGGLDSIPWMLLGAGYTLMMEHSIYIHSFRGRIWQLTATWKVEKNTGYFGETFCLHLQDRSRWIQSMHSQVNFVQFISIL